MFDDKTIHKQKNFADTVLSLGCVYNVSVTSWGRTPKHNKAVGGEKDSKHMQWLAVDLVIDEERDREPVIRYLRDCGCFVLDEGTHIHVHSRE